MLFYISQEKREYYLKKAMKLYADMPRTNILTGIWIFVHRVGFARPNDAVERFWDLATR